MRFLITGTAGFIGSHLTEHLLRRGHQVVGVDNFEENYSRNLKLKNLDECVRTLKEKDRFTFIEGDICEAKHIVASNLT